MKKELMTESIDEQNSANKTVSDESVPNRADELGEEEFETDQSDSEGWEEKSEGNDTGWE